MSRFGRAKSCNWENKVSLRLHAELRAIGPRIGLENCLRCGWTRRGRLEHVPVRWKHLEYFLYAKSTPIVHIDFALNPEIPVFDQTEGKKS